MNSFFKKDIANFALERGIRVIPELDVPGHTKSWSANGVFPEVIAHCPTYEHNENNIPLQPFKEETWNLIREVFTFVGKIFDDPYFHIGSSNFLNLVKN